MKKIIYFISAIILVLLFISGCRETRAFELEQSTDQITKIQIVEISIDKTALLKELSKEDNTNIIKDISNLTCYRYWTPNQTIAGQAIKIFYINGDYEIITVACHAYYSNDDQSFRDGYFSADPFANMLNKYLEE